MADGPLPIRNDRSRLVLIADDQTSVRHYLCEAFEQAGYRTAEARDGRDVLRLVQGPEPFDAIVLDIVMPDVEGLETLRCLQKAGITTPVVAISGAMDAQYLGVAKRFGATEALYKPFSAETLVKIVDRILASASAEESKSPTGAQVP